ncbi:MAG: GDP-mannose 4,6-dehydratase, partial [Nitrospirota bacterium]|nr:GDP-mannose 4,6-dehydratase [Nitrospirota bacterium]
DDLSTGSLENVRHLEGNDRFHCIVDSVMNRDRMTELIGICDMVIHLAAAVGVKYIIDNPLHSIQTNIGGTEVVLELANKFRKKVLIASTSEVYGKHTHAPLTETDNVIYGPSTTWRWSYAAGKLIDEFMALAYHRTKKLPVLIVRFFNTVGPRQTGRYGMVIPRFVQQALRDEPITVHGDGTQTRTFTYVRDVTEAIVNLMDCPEAVGEVINIGGDEEVSIGNLAARIKEMTGSRSEIRYIPYSEAYEKDFEDMQRRVPDLSKINRLVGFTPKAGLDDILGQVIEYFKTERDSIELA